MHTVLYKGTHIFNTIGNTYAEKGSLLVQHGKKNDLL